jgi:membrane associated rhomboid family serine protease
LIKKDLTIDPDDSWQTVFESTSRKECADRSLVLQAVDIRFELLQDGERSLLVVPADVAERARHELWEYETENRPRRAPAVPLQPVYQDGTWGVVGYIVVISLVAVLAGEGVFGRDWYAAGRVDGALIRAGEWWRTVTALTLHSGLPHFAGNVGFGALFGIMAGRVLGPGVTWLAVLVAAALGNLVNTLLLESAHRSIGASTAVFAALGLVAGFSWRARFFRQDRWAYRLGPVVGGVALLAYTGTGDADTDIGAHLAGFACGFLSGAAITAVYRFVPDPRIQKFSAAAAVAIVLAAWTAAL